MKIELSVLEAEHIYNVLFSLKEKEVEVEDVSEELMQALEILEAYLRK